MVYICRNPLKTLFVFASYLVNFYILHRATVHRHGYLLDTWNKKLRNYNVCQVFGPTYSEYFINSYAVTSSTRIFDCSFFWQPAYA